MRPVMMANARCADCIKKKPHLLFHKGEIKNRHLTVVDILVQAGSLTSMVVESEEKDVGNFYCTFRCEDYSCLMNIWFEAAISRKVSRDMEAHRRARSDRKRKKKKDKKNKQNR